MKVLVISNMGAKKSAPLQGLFVDNQVKYLNELLPDLEYYQLSWNGDNIFFRLFKYPFFFAKFIVKYIFSHKCFDIIHIHYFYPTILCALLYKALKNPKVKIIVTCHGGDIYSFQPPNWIYKKTSIIVDLWIFTSAKLKESFYRSVPHSVILCAGYNEKIFYFKPKLSNEPTPIDCLLVGSCDKNKGIDRLLELVKQMPKVNFTVVGQGYMSHILEKKMLQHSNLQWLGSQSPQNIANLMRQSKYLLSLSRNESFGLVIAESHACGTPCIVTETDGSLEQLGDWPFMVSQKSLPEEQIICDLKNKINTALLLSTEDYNKLQSTVIKESKKYSLSKIVESIYANYQYVIDKKTS